MHLNYAEHNTPLTDPAVNRVVRGQMNGVCGASREGRPGGPTAGQRNEAVRRSRSQGTRKLQKCLSTASYSEEARPPPPSNSTHQSLLVTRQYCSFGSTVT